MISTDRGGPPSVFLHVKALAIGGIVGYLSLIVHRARSADLPWGIVLAWVLVGAAGIALRIEAGARPALTFAGGALLTPLAITQFSRHVFALNDWRTSVWFIGSCAVVIIATAFGAYVRPRPQARPDGEEMRKP
ncbi:MAG: hypothetical protein Q4P36_04855 [Bowdeniella nasicola]|nr:hypothetical protein [Bowdeniella nasicola]